MNRPTSLQVDVTLTNFSIGYQPQNLIAEKVLPVVPIANEQGVYFEWNKADAFNITNTLRADGTRPETVNINAKKVAFNAEQYMVDVPITDREERNAAGVLRLRQNKTRRGQDTILVDQERRVANLLRQTLPGETLSGTDKWSSDDNKAILTQIDEAKEMIRQGTGGLEPNTIIIPRAATRHLMRLPFILDMLKYTRGDLLVNGELPPNIRGLNVLIPGAMMGGGLSASGLVDVWGSDVIIAHVSELPEVDMPSLGYILRNGEFSTYVWRDDSIETNYIRPSLIQAEVVTHKDCGYVLRDVL